MKVGKEIGNQVLHIVMTLSVLTLIAFFPNAVWSYAIAGFWFMFWREDATHRIGQKEGWAWVSPVSFKRTRKTACCGTEVKDKIGGWTRWMDIGFGTLGAVGAGLFAYFF